MYRGEAVALQVDQGILFVDFELDQPLPDFATRYWKQEPIYAIRGMEQPPVLSFTVMGYSQRHLALVRETLMYHPQSITCLGPGIVCHNCGSKNPSGVLRCVFCGGDVVEKEWITPASLMGRAACLEWSHPAIARSSDEPPTEQWEIALDPDIDCFALMQAITGGQARILPVGSVLDEGLYLCHHCGRATPIGETCAGCGGEQMPLAEVVKIDRKCLCCGTKTMDGVLCPRCGRAFASESYKQWAKA